MRTYIHVCLAPDFSFASNLQGLKENVFHILIFFHWEKICSAYCFFLHIHLLTSKGWGLLQCWCGSRSIPPCALFQETLECVGPDQLFFPPKNCMWYVTCIIGNSLGWPRKRRNPPFFVKTVPSLILKPKHETDEVTIIVGLNKYNCISTILYQSLHNWTTFTLLIVFVVTCQNSGQWSFPGPCHVLGLYFEYNLLHR